MNKVKRSVVTGVMMAVYAGLSACGMGEDVYHYGVVPFGAQYNTQEMMEELIATCELTPADIVMIDLNSDAFRDTFRGDTCAQIKIGLEGYRERFGDQIASMGKNPGLTTSLPTTQGVQYALLSAALSGPYVTTQVFVDFHADTVSFGENITANMGGATVVPLSGEGRQAILAGFEPLTRWGLPWTQTSEPRDDTGGFGVMVIGADGVLYHWTGLWSTADTPQTIPPDFVTVYDAFMALVPK